MGAYDEEVAKVICSYCSDDEQIQECLRFVSSLGDFSYVGYTNIDMYGDGDVYNPVVFLSEEFNKLQSPFRLFRIDESNEAKFIRSVNQSDSDYYRDQKK